MDEKLISISAAALVARLPHRVRAMIAKEPKQARAVARALRERDFSAVGHLPDLIRATVSLEIREAGRGKPAAGLTRLRTAWAKATEQDKAAFIEEVGVKPLR
jgi:hypothetical protein